MKVDVVVSVKNTGSHWKECLDSFYREIPINRLLIGDGGCTDKTIDIVKQYPNTVIFDHSKFKTLGFSLRKLVEEVNTEWFIYLHSDVVLPPNWFTEMSKYCDRWDLFECKRIGVYPDGTKRELKEQFQASRAYSGSQMGKTKILKQVVAFIDDDFVYRTEDIVIQNILTKMGGKYGKAPTTYHYHFLKSDTLTRKDHFQSITSIIKYQGLFTKQNMKCALTNVRFLLFQR